jgi:hypothetical protein
LTCRCRLAVNHISVLKLVRTPRRELRAGKHAITPDETDVHHDRENVHDISQALGLSPKVELNRGPARASILAN